MKKIGIALGSGGAKGVSHIGVLEVRISEISGTSIGVIIGGLYAAGVAVEEIKEIALSINLKKLFELFDFTRPKTGGIVKGELIEKFLDNILPIKKLGVD